MNTANPSIESLEDIAADWAVRRAGGLPSNIEAEFERWLAADPQHFAAFAEADLALSVLSPPSAKADREELSQELVAWENQRRATRGRRRRVLYFSIGLAAAAAVVVSFVPGVWKLEEAHPPVMVARPLVQKLPDGSVIELNANAEIAVDYSPATRGVRLLHGEAHFAVAKDASRPFVVSAGPVSVRAVGTAFDVSFKPEAVAVLVTEGKVRVTDSTTPLPTTRTESTPPPRELDLMAGHRTEISLAVQTPPVSAPVSSTDIQRKLAWREMRFELSNATLEQAVTLFNRKGQTQLAIGDPELRERRISGIYWADNPRQFAELIEASLEIRAVQDESGQITFRK